MTIQDLGSVGELVAAIATVVTLVYLAIQIRSNTIATRSAAAQSVHEAFTTWYRLLAADVSLGRLLIPEHPSRRHVARHTPLLARRNKNVHAPVQHIGHK